MPTRPLRPVPAPADTDHPMHFSYTVNPKSGVITVTAVCDETGCPLRASWQYKPIPGFHGPSQNEGRTTIEIVKKS